VPDTLARLCWRNRDQIVERFSADVEAATKTGEALSIVHRQRLEADVGIKGLAVEPERSF
jgi:hypothetical protein